MEELIKHWTVLINYCKDLSELQLSAGVLVEARYRIKDVRKRTYVRSTVLKNILTSLRNNKIPLSAPTVKIASGN